MQTSTAVLLLALAAAGPAAASRLAGSSRARITGSFLRAGMRPEIVARSLAKVEDEWKSQFRLYVECNATANSKFEAQKCEAAPKAFEHACGTIVSAVVQASNGDHAVVREYMDDICNEPQLQGWRSGRCKLLASSVLAGMTEDNYDNRERLNAAPLCQSFWARFSTEEQELLHQETAKREAEEKQRAEEREAEEKRAAEVAAEEEKRRREEEEEEAKQRAEEEAARLREEEELKRQAEESAARLQNKREASSNATTETKESANATAQNQVVTNTTADIKEAANATTQASAANATSGVSAQNASQEAAVTNTTGNVSVRDAQEAAVANTTGDSVLNASQVAVLTNVTEH